MQKHQTTWPQSALTGMCCKTLVAKYLALCWSAAAAARPRVYLLESASASLPDTRSATAFNIALHKPSMRPLSSKWCAATHKARGFKAKLSTCMQPYTRQHCERLTLMCAMQQQSRECRDSSLAYTWYVAYRMCNAVAVKHKQEHNLTIMRAVHSDHCC